MMTDRRRVRADGVSVTTPPPFPVMLDPDLPPGFDPDARGDDDMADDYRSPFDPQTGEWRGFGPVTSVNGQPIDMSTRDDAPRTAPVVGVAGDGMPLYGTPAPEPPTVVFPEGMTLEEALAALAATRDGSGRIGPATASALGIPELPDTPPSVRAVAVDAAARLVASAASRSTADGLARETVQAADILARYITTGETR